MKIKEIYKRLNEPIQVSFFGLCGWMCYMGLIVSDKWYEKLFFFVFVIIGIINWAIHNPPEE